MQPITPLELRKCEVSQGWQLASEESFKNLDIVYCFLHSDLDTFAENDAKRQYMYTK